MNSINSIQTDKASEISLEALKKKHLRNFIVFVLVWQILMYGVNAYLFAYYNIRIDYIDAILLLSPILLYYARFGLIYFARFYKEKANE